MGGLLSKREKPVGGGSAYWVDYPAIKRKMPNKIMAVDI
jgi:hypothetical protein